MHEKQLAFVITFSFVVFFNTSFSGAKIGAPAWLESPKADRIIHVDQEHPKSSDSKSGEKVWPLKTISAAAELAMRNRKRGFSTKIVIHPGVYRESIRLSSEAQIEGPPIVFEAKKNGKTTISGSEIWTEWEETEWENVYVHRWPYRWGLRPYPPGWRNHITLKYLTRRREMVFADGKPLEQVTSLTSLAKGTFFVSEDKGQIFISLPKRKPPSDTIIEVGTRGSLFYTEGISNVRISGITFQHAVSGIEGSAMWISNAKNIMLVDCVFTWNNWTGYRFHGLTNVTSRRNTATKNGGTGHTAWKVKSYLSEDDNVSYNNWRGKAGEFFYWAVAGVKGMRIHDALFRRHSARGNYAAGFWLDFDNVNVRVEDSLWCNNLKHGLFIEASQGPITVINTRIYNNSEWGIRSIASSHISLIRNQIVRNAGQQIFLTGASTRVVNNWETQQQLEIKMTNWELTENTVSSDNNVLLDTPNWGHFFRSLRSRNNTWIRSKRPGAFKVQDERLTFEKWKNLSKQDLDSSFINPASHHLVLSEDCN